ncbi:hypothetical protein [Bergeriella denitrificans]|uniref:Phage associated protein n=1 Tax=Bergeriella denitrificans TaxID=494 RepID=A0A378UJ34_BERDE|nr:hypothetical protein [Bergeriella denitrificans]STZ77356.1 phage associated protein [Bergeriella denitrificans]
MTNISPEAKKRYAKTATAINQAKLKSGEYRRIGVQGKAAEMDIIDAAIAKAGGSKTQALVAICSFYLENA